MRNARVLRANYNVWISDLGFTWYNYKIPEWIQQHFIKNSLQIKKYPNKTHDSQVQRGLTSYVNAKHTHSP